MKTLPGWRRAATVPGVIAALVVLVQCSGGSPPGPGGTGRPATGYFTEAASPLTVSVLTEATGAVRSTVPATGGVVTATGVDGSVFTLTVPAGALEADTEITMTPITGVTGLPLGGGLGAAVKLEPDGLRFLNWATLTIAPSRSIALDRQAFFGFAGSGDDFHLEIPTLNRGAIELKLLHFSGHGAADGTAADRSAILARRPLDAENRLTQLLAARLIEARARGNVTEADLAAFREHWQAYHDQVVVPRVRAAGDSCAAGTLALQTTLGLERQRQLLGEGTAGGMDDVKSLLPQVAKSCIDEKKDCATALSFARQKELLGLDVTFPASAQSKIDQCLGRNVVSITETGTFHEVVTTPGTADVGAMTTTKDASYSDARTVTITGVTAAYPLIPGVNDHAGTFFQARADVVAGQTMTVVTHQDSTLCYGDEATPNWRAAYDYDYRSSLAGNATDDRYSLAVRVYQDGRYELDITLRAHPFTAAWTSHEVGGCAGANATLSGTEAVSDRAQLVTVTGQVDPGDPGHITGAAEIRNVYSRAILGVSVNTTMFVTWDLVL